MFRSLWACCAVLVLAGCNVSVIGAGDPGAPSPLAFKDQGGQGKINGHPWSYLSGRAKIMPPNTLEVSLWSDAQSFPCTRQTPSDYSVRLYTDPVVKSYSIDGRGTLLIMSDFTHPGQPSQSIQASEGTIEITNFTRTRVKGRMMARAQGATGIGESEVNGNFDVPYCP